MPTQRHGCWVPSFALFDVARRDAGLALASGDTRIVCGISIRCAACCGFGFECVFDFERSRTRHHLICKAFSAFQVRFARIQQV
jgi:hypothetical protein